MEALSLIIKIILVIFSVFLIIVVLLQSSQQRGVPGAVGGAAEAMFGKKKAKGMDALLIKLTKFSAIGFMILAIILAIIQKYGINA